MTVAVIIVSFDCADHVINCLRALYVSHVRPDVIHICENAGSSACAELVDAVASAFEADRTEAWADPGECVLAQTRLDPRTGGPKTVIHCAAENIGYAGGVNVCIRALDGLDWDAVFVVNPDATVAPQALGHLTAYAGNGRYGVVGCRLLFAETGRVQMFGGRWRPWLARAVNVGLDLPGDAKPDVTAVECQIDYVCGGAMLVTRAYFDAVGPMDERYFLYMEEVDYCFRRGDLLLGYAHDAVVTHLHGATTGANRDSRRKSPLTIYLSERNRLGFTRRFFPWHYPVVLVATFCMTLVYLKRAGMGPFRTALAGWWAGVRGETGRPIRVPS